ncbi:unnamed protein product [Schistosoma mattheei]|uniref:Uncharacterized protein n=1 Tax=Schistosoma mattheei TaxID=31246 RepID=A0A183P593_9TREM|nr:unnamed protein product [Schistosoma mattheei]
MELHISLKALPRESSRCVTLGMFASDVQKPYPALKRGDLTDRQRLDQISNNVDLQHSSATDMLLRMQEKYAYALETLPGDHIAAVREFVLDSNAPNAYGCLKESILRHFLPRREERLGALLACYPLGDAKPNHYLTRLQSLAEPTTADPEVVKELWVESLLASIQPTVTALLEDTPLNEVALIADKILARTSIPDN